MRRDARRRREALLLAARDCFREHGYQAPLDEVASRAGVGRGTLYRNLKDRLALLIALFAHDMDEMQARVAEAEDLSSALKTLIVCAAPLAALYGRLALELPQDAETLASLQTLEAKAEALLRPIMGRARRDGLLRGDVGSLEVSMLLRMASGLILPFHDEGQADAVAERALSLIMDGLRPR